MERMEHEIDSPIANDRRRWSSHVQPESEDKLLWRNRCGIACWRPHCLKPLRDIRAFIAAICFISCLQAAFSGYTSSQITTIEKRFSIGSVIIGVINSSFEVGYICFVMLVSYGGSKGRVPFWIACGLFSMSLGALLYSLPQFLFTQKPVSLTYNEEKLCRTNASYEPPVQSDTCDGGTGTGYSFLPILMVAQFLIGAGSSPILTLAPPFIDDHVPPKKAPAMIASIYAAAALGPVFGYALGAVLLQVRVDIFSTVKIFPPSITSSSPSWIGAWWIGYIILGSGVAIGGVILLMFPRNLLSTSVDGFQREANRLQESDELITFNEPVSVNNSGSHLQDNVRTNDSSDNRCYGDVQLYGQLSNNLSSLGPRHHRRTASGGSVLMHAAIAAATASLTAQAWPSTEDGVDDDDDDNDYGVYEREKNVFNFQRHHSCEPPRDSRQLYPKLRVPHKVTFDSRSRHGSLSNSWCSRANKHDFTRPPLHFSPDLNSRSAKKRCLARPSISSENINSEEALRSNSLTPYFEARSRSSSPLPLQEKTNSEGDKSSINWDMIHNDTELTLMDNDDLPTSPKPGEPSQQTRFSSNSNLNPKDRSDSENGPGRDNTNLQLRRLKSNRRRTRKLLRGRIFGFIPVWSKDIPASILALLRNKVYLVTCMCICCEMFLVIGFAGFLPKYMETEYQISKAKASMIAGGLIVPSGALGILVGGLILNKGQLGRRTAIILVLSINIVIIFCLASFFFLGCETPKVAGLNAPYPVGVSGPSSTTAVEESEFLNLNQVQCTASCGCDVHEFLPVCHRKTKTLFITPCFAGCSKGPVSAESAKSKVYWNCTCLSSFPHPEISRGSPDYVETDLVYDDEVIIGLCSFKCSTLIPFICFLTVCLFLTGVIQNPLLMVTMRSVSSSERALGLGFQFVIVRLLASLPSPIAFGHAIDGACLRWQYDCGRKGDCSITDLRSLTLYITVLALTIKLFSVVVYIILIYLIPPNSPDYLNDLTRITASCHTNDILLNADSLPNPETAEQAIEKNHQSQTSNLDSVNEAISTESKQ